jgi:hypothetical protein
VSKGNLREKREGGKPSKVNSFEYFDYTPPLITAPLHNTLLRQIKKNSKDMLRKLIKLIIIASVLKK